MRNHPPEKITWEAILADPSLLRALLEYDASTGELTWKKRPRLAFASDRAWKVWNARFCGSVCNSRCAQGYIRMSIDGSYRLAHRVAWALHYGSFPEHAIDHINGCKSDNRISNLRDVPLSLNQRNCRLYKNNKSGEIGVSWFARTKKWRVEVAATHIGYFENIDDAISARRKAAKKLGFSERHGASQ